MKLILIVLDVDPKKEIHDLMKEKRKKNVILISFLIGCNHIVLF